MQTVGCEFANSWPTYTQHIALHFRTTMPGVLLYSPAGAATGAARARGARARPEWHGCGKLYRARSRLYRSHILQVNSRWKALAEIYTMHSFAPLSNLKIFVQNC